MSRKNQFLLTSVRSAGCGFGRKQALSATLHALSYPLSVVSVADLPVITQ